MMSPSGVYLRKNARRKYDAILKSACRLFLKHGYTHTSMDAIAADAGVSKQTVYSYFTNKDVLFCHMIEDECNKHSPPDSLLENPSLTPEDALLRIAQGFMDTITSHRGLAIHRVVMAEAGRYPRIAQLFFDCGPRKMMRLLSHYLERQVSLGHLKIDNIELASTHFFAMLKGWHQMRMVLRLKPAPSKRELQAHVRDTVAAFCKIHNI